MKIEVTGQALTTTVQKPGSPAAQPGGEPFGQVLSQTIAATKPPTDSGAAAVVEGLGRLHLQGLPPLQEAPASRQVGHYLDLLSDYQKQLADPRVSLRAMEPAVKRLQEAQGEMQRLVQNLPPGHPLQRIGTQSLVLGSLETGRYYEGHYAAR
jgi:hypothetical protein